MLYRPESGRLWDPTIYVWHGQYWMLAMHYDKPADPGTGMWVARSEDGVHWRGVGRVLEDADGLFKMFVCEDKEGRLRLNYGSSSNGRDNDTMKYAVSGDMVSWEIVEANHPDPRWYQTSGRWDHMYMTRDAGRYVGAVVATPKPEFNSCFGLQESPDGVHWTPLPPPAIDWGGIPPIDCLEGGGLAKIGNEYYYLGGYVGYAGSHGYNVYVFRANHIEGPYRPDAGAFRLCGFDRLPRVFVQNLAALYNEGDEWHMGNAISADGGDEVWVLPSRRIRRDDNGHLHLCWRAKNEAIRGDAIPDARFDFQWGDEMNLPDEPTVTDRYALRAFSHAIDFDEGLYLTGAFTAQSAPPHHKDLHKTHCWRPARIGFAIGEGEGKASAVTLDIGHPYKRKSNILALSWDKEMHAEIIDETGEDAACVQGVSADEVHTFRLLVRRNMYELYIDDDLAQSFVTMSPPDGKLYLYLQNAKCELQTLEAHKTSLPNPPHTP